MPLFIKRDPKLLFPTAYGRGDTRINLPPGNFTVENEVIALAISQDTAFLKDAKAGMHSFEYVAPKAAELAAAIAAKDEGAETVVDLNKVNPIEKLVGKGAEEFIAGIVDAKELFRIVWNETRKGLKTKAIEALEKIYGRKLTESELSAPPAE